MEGLIKLLNKLESEKPVSEPDEEPPSPVMHLVPRTRTIPPLSDDEVTALRGILRDVAKIVAGCPIARRALKESNDA